MRIYPVKKNPIGSAVSKILRYKHTDRQTYFIIRIDNFASGMLAPLESGSGAPSQFRMFTLLS